MLFDRLLEERGSLINELKTLSEVEPTEEAYPGLHKAAMEARRLLIDKLIRATEGIPRQKSLLNNNLAAFDGELMKIVNLTTDAIVTHGRYVRALFTPQIGAIESRLRELHQLASQMHVIIEEALRGINSLDSISSKINSQKELVQQSDDLQNEIKLLETKASELECLTKSKNDQLAKLIASEEFKRVAKSGLELERIEQGIVQVKSMASGALSDLSRPFRKMEKLVISGGYQLDRELLEVLKLCIENPSEIISSEEKIGATETILKKTVELLSEGKISLDDRERRKKLERARELVGKLREFWEHLKRLRVQHETQKSAFERSPLLKERAELERSIRAYEVELKQAQANIQELHEKLKRTDEEIKVSQSEIKKMAPNVVGTELEITF